MGSTSYLGKPKSGGYRAKSGSSVGSDKDVNGKLRRPKIRRPMKLNDYGIKRIPDYTELAYKEAVSKLRYFLAGNYAPSLRSYGGSASIKNLDDIDDKKYSLAEYKSRPRLAAKYATLYADSLGNAYKQAPSTVPVSNPDDLSGGTNPDVINFIQKQEEYIEQLERESQYCRDELNNLLGKVKEVISENENMHEAQKNKLISRMFHSYNAGSETDELDDLGDSTGLDSDHKATPSKLKKAGKPRSRLEGPNIVFESRIAELEAQLTQARIDLKKVQEENNENKRKLASGLVDSTCLDGFKRQIDNLQRDKTSLEAQISKLKVSLEQRDPEDGKYRRGSDVIENQLREERNNLEVEVRRLKDDLAKERSKIRELAGEGARRAIQERSAAEQRYNAHFDELQHDLAAQYDNVSKLHLELDRQRREENDLKRELSMKTSAIEELKMELKNKTATLQADLTQAQAEKASLEEELANARLAIERQQRQAKHETNRLNSEIQSLRQRLDRADADLVHSRRENLRLAEQISTLEKEMNMKNLTPISPEKKKDKEKEISNMFESMENKHAKTVAELESMIQSQNSLMEKLTGECRLLTDKLDDANRRHKEELATLQRQVDTLGRSLTTPDLPHSAYTAQPTLPTQAFRTEPVTSPARPDNTRTDSARHSPDRTYEPRTFSRRESRQSINPEPVPETIDAPVTKFETPKPEIDNEEKETAETNDNYEKYAENYEETDKAAVETNDDYQAQDYTDPNYQYEQNYDTSNPNYEQADYQNQGYDQQYDTQGQYEGNTQYEGHTEPYVGDTQQYESSPQQYENYDQYQQEYTDPNAQYDGQYQNVNYTEGEVPYEKDAVENVAPEVDNQKPQGQSKPQPEYKQNIQPQNPTKPTTVPESKRSNTPEQKKKS